METTTERTVLYGLRHRGTGKPIRVRSETVVLQDEPYYNEDTTFHMTLDEGYPVFDAGSPEVLAGALLPRSGSSEEYPNPGNFTIADVEPMRVETVVTRTLAPLDLAMERTTMLGYAMAYDLNRRYAKAIPGLMPFLDALDEHQDELSAGNDPGGDFPRDKARLCMLAVPQPRHELEDLVGGIASQGAGNHRRVVGVVDMPDGRKWMHLASRYGVDPEEACLLVCLQDKRPVTEAFLEQVSDRGAGMAP